MGISMIALIVLFFLGGLTVVAVIAMIYFIVREREK